jgi:hypothetical protein
MIDNDMIIEQLYIDALEEVEEKFRFSLEQEEKEILAEKIARERFER